MKKFGLSMLLIGSTTLLSACTTMTALHDKLANAEIQKKQLADGSTVYVDYNVTPTANWSCKSIGTPQYYNWQQIQAAGQFHLTGAHGLLTEKALAYANQQNLKPNYINLQIPEEDTFSTGSGNFTSSMVLNSDAQAIASYYQCQQINPEHKIGWEKKKDIGVRVGNSDNNPIPI